MKFSGLFYVKFYLSVLTDLNCSITNSNLKLAQFVSLEAIHQCYRLKAELCYLQIITCSPLALAENVT